MRIPIDSKMTAFGVTEYILQQIVDVFAQYPEVECAAIFGSRARGDFKNGSDIDIAIYAPKMSSTNFSSLCFAVDALPIIFKIDMVHVERLGNEALLAAIQRDGKKIYNSNSNCKE